jgi:asparagine synthase (glutamine-hydrolysing)
MLARLNGFFAIAIHDRRDDRLFLARDRMGVKPLHYAETPRGLLFGSQLKTLLAEGSLAREVDPAALLDFLCVRYVPAPRTIWKGARKLPAGHYLLARRDGNGGCASRSRSGGTCRRSGRGRSRRRRRPRSSGSSSSIR